MKGCEIKCSTFTRDNCILVYEGQNSLNQVIIPPGNTHTLSSRDILTVKIIKNNGSVIMAQTVDVPGEHDNKFSLLC